MTYDTTHVILMKLTNLIALVTFPFQNNQKNFNPSYKMDRDFWNCYSRDKPSHRGTPLDRFIYFSVSLETEKPYFVAKQIW